MNREDKEGNIVSFILFRYLPYWPLFIVLFIIGLGAAWGYLQYATPLYEASATILVKDDKKGADDSGVEEALNIFSSKKIVENEIEVIKSYKLMYHVVNELNLYAPVFEKGKFRPIAAYESSPVAILARYPQQLKTSNPVDFSVKGNKEVIIESKAYPMDQWVVTPYGELKFVKNAKQVAEPQNPLFFQTINPERAAASLVRRLGVKSSNKLSTVLDVSLTDEVRQRGEDVLNKLVEVYNRASLDEKNTLAQNTLKFIDNRLHTVEKELDSLEGRIQQYRAQKGVIDLSQQSRLYLDNVGASGRRVEDVNLKLSVLNEVEKYVNSKDANSGILPSTLGVEDPTLSNLVQRLSTAQVEYEKLKNTTGEKNPLVTPLAKEIEHLRPQIMENIKNQRSNLLASRSNLSATSGAFTAMLNSIQIIKNDVYSFLLQQREKIQLTISSNVSNSKVIDLAQSSGGPVSPKTSIIYLSALICALVLGVGIVSGKELLNRKILFRSEIESYTTIPVVAEIPNVKKKDSLLHNKSHGSVAAEQFRQLRAAIGLYNTNLNQKRLLVTSSISGEGKSYISTNLAVSFAISGKKVALIDLDIRNPKVTSVMGLLGEPGIVEYLAGKKTAREIINKTEYENLFVIGAGGESEEAMELILSGKLNDLLLAIQDDFDYIVMDTSPIDPVTDAYVFSDYCDRTLFVVRHAYTPKTIVQLFDENSKVKALKNPVIVFNDVRSRGFLKGTYGYGYGYGYSSVYRVENKTKRRRMLEI
jgi:tyrosine-protein kinase Etk/Wzc